MNRLLVERSISEDDLRDEISKFAAHFDKPFVLNLIAPMGCGKSTFVRALLYHLGLNPKIPVTSPTFTLMNDYNIGERWFAHLDLYRLTGRPDMEEWGLLDVRPFFGIFIEWPEIISSGEFGKLVPTHELRIAYAKDFGCRLYTLYSCGKI